MKIITLVATLVSIFFSNTGLAKTHYAKVINVTPVYKYLTISTPVEICHRPNYPGNHHNPAGTALGAIIGGTIGHAIDQNSRSGNVATAAGVLVGGVIGHQLTNDKSAKRMPVEHCVTSYEQTKKVRKLEGYNVQYRFNGHTYQTFSSQNPGKKIMVRDKIRVVVGDSPYYSSTASSQRAFQNRYE